MIDIIAELSDEVRINQISDTEHADDIRELLTYDENSAGGLMAKELVCVSKTGQSLVVREMRIQAQEVTRVHSIYVVDNENIYCLDAYLSKICLQRMKKARLRVFIYRKSIM